MVSSLLIVVNAISVISRLCDVVLIHIVGLLDNQMVGMSMTVGKIIFNIVADLSFVRNQFRRCWRL